MTVDGRRFIFVSQMEETAPPSLAVVATGGDGDVFQIDRVAGVTPDDIGVADCLTK
jgi:hypothetical protein